MTVNKMDLEKIDKYLSISASNIFIYKELTEFSSFINLFKPLYFFEKLYSFLEKIENNIKKTETLRVELNYFFKREKFTPKQEVYFYARLCQKLIDFYGKRNEIETVNYNFQRNVFVNLATEYVKYKVDAVHNGHITRDEAKILPSLAVLLANFHDIEFYPNTESISEINTELKWENQTELSELIYVLFHSKRVLKNGKPIQQKDLTELFNKIFNTDIKEPTDLLKKSMTSNKVVYDGKTFISELNSILEVYKKKTLDKEK